jgi:hypothetical protein
MANPAHTRDHVWVPKVHSFSTPAAREARRGLEQRAPPVGCAKAVSATRSRPGRWIVLEDRQKRARKAEARLFKIAHRRQRLGMKLVC